MNTSQEPLPRLAALQHRDFRLLWLGQLVSTTGTNMQYLAVNWHIFALLQDLAYSVTIVGHEFSVDADALGLGTLGLVRVIPIVLFALLGGMLADVRDRRRLLIQIEVVAALISATLAAMTWSGRASVPAIYLLTAAAAAAAAFRQPARQSLVPNIVPREHLTNAVSLNTLVTQIGTISGPALAGLLIGQFDLGLVYAIDALSFVAVVLALLLMRTRARVAAHQSGLGWATLVEGLRYTYGMRLIRSTMLLDFFATLFSSARTMLPIVASDILHVGVEGYGLLATAQPLGAVGAGAIASLRRNIHRQGVALLLGVATYGLATALFGLSTVYVLSFVLFAITGAGDTVSTVIRSTIRQVVTPDHLRGRMTSVNMIFFMGGPQLGEMEAGLAAAVLGVPTAIFAGGLATVLLTGWVAWRYPGLRRYTSDSQIWTPGVQ